MNELIFLYPILIPIAIFSLAYLIAIIYECLEEQKGASEVRK